MILLDTNVLSALMLARPAEAVVAWLDRQEAPTVWTTSVTVFEVRFGLARIGEVARRERLLGAFQAIVEDELGGRVAPFDTLAAQAAAALAATRQAEGRTVDFRDTQIAGIAMARNATIATRNVRHFQDCGQPIVDPWRADIER